jgi:rhamnose utilization protein RhaD (predicted bifunctional aldolase and dehydrogenase)
MPVKSTSVGMKWTDAKGRTWEVMRMLAFGRYEVATADRKNTAEMRGDEIRLAIERQKK